MLVLALINCLVKYPMVCCCSRCCGCCCSCCCCFCCCAAKSLRTFKSHLQRNQLRNWDQIYHNLGRFWKVAKISKKRRVISIYSINSCWSCPSLVCPRVQNGPAGIIVVYCCWPVITTNTSGVFFAFLTLFRSI